MWPQGREEGTRIQAPWPRIPGKPLALTPSLGASARRQSLDQGTTTTEAHVCPASSLSVFNFLQGGGDGGVGCPCIFRV